MLGAGYWVASAAQWLYQYLLSSQAADLATVAQSQILGYPAGCVCLRAVVLSAVVLSAVVLGAAVSAASDTPDVAQV